MDGITLDAVKATLEFVLVFFNRLHVVQRFDISRLASDTRKQEVYIALLDLIIGFLLLNSGSQVFRRLLLPSALLIDNLFDDIAPLLLHLLLLPFDDS